MTKPSATEKCQTCGRFMKYEPGASYTQEWHMDSSGESDGPDDPVWQCEECTAKHGRLHGNCWPPGAYSGILT